MGIFNSDRFTRPGPGVPKGLTRKKGVRRFFELVARDHSNLMLISLIQTASYVPILVLYLLAVSYSLPVMVLCFFLTGLYGIFLGPCCVACMTSVSKSLRDAPEFFWHDWKKTFKNSVRQSAAVGVVYALACSLQFFAVFVALSTSLTMLVVLFLSVLLFHAVMPYFFLQAGYLELKPGAMVKNAILLALSKLPRSLMGALLPLAGAISLVFFLPGVLLAAIIGTGLMSLWQVMWIWPAIDSAFSIEEEFNRRNAEAIEDVEKIDFHDPYVES